MLDYIWTLSIERVGVFAGWQKKRGDWVLKPSSQEVKEEQLGVGVLNYLREDRTGEQRWGDAR